MLWKYGHLNAKSHTHTPAKWNAENYDDDYDRHDKAIRWHKQQIVIQNNEIEKKSDWGKNINNNNKKQNGYESVWVWYKLAKDEIHNREKREIVTQQVCVYLLLFIIKTIMTKKEMKKKGDENIIF